MRFNMPFGRVGAGEFGTYFIGYAAQPGRDRADADEHVHRQPARQLRPDPRLLDRGHRQPVLRAHRRLPRRPAARATRVGATAATDAGRRRRGGRVARNRQPERSLAMNHLLRARADQRRGLELLDDEARERLAPALAARKLVDFSGPHGWEHSATNLGRTTRAARRPRATGVVGPPAPRAAAGRGPRRLRALPRRAARRRPRRRRCRSRAARPRRAPDRRGRERRRVPRLGRRDHRHRRGLAARAAALGEARTSTRARVAARGRAAARERDRRPLRAGARARAVPAGDRDGRARRLPAARAPAQDPRRPDRLGAGRERRGRPQPARRRLHLRVRPGPVDRLRLARRRASCGCTSRRASASTSPRPRRRSR